MSSQSERWIDHFIRMAQRRANKTYKVDLPNVEKTPQVTPQQQTYEQAVENIQEEKQNTKAEALPKKKRGRPKKSIASTAAAAAAAAASTTAAELKKTSKKTPGSIQKKDKQKKAINKAKLEKIVKSTVFAKKN